MAQPKHIKLVSIWSGHILLLAIGFVILVPILAWLAFPDVLKMDEIGLAARFLNQTELTRPKQIMGLLVTLLPVSCLVYALFKLRRVFREYSKGRVFSLTAVRALRSVGIGGCALVLAQFLVTPLMSLAMTYDFADGDKNLSVVVGITAGGLLGFFAALMFLVLAWVMNEARQNAEDLAQIV
jgi:hypothetical protein